MRRFFKWLGQPVALNTAVMWAFMAAAFAMLIGSLAGPIAWVLS